MKADVTKYDAPWASLEYHPWFNKLHLFLYQLVHNGNASHFHIKYFMGPEKHIVHLKQKE